MSQSKETITFIYPQRSCIPKIFVELSEKFPDDCKISTENGRLTACIPESWVKISATQVLILNKHAIE